MSFDTSKIKLHGESVDVHHEDFLKGDLPANLAKLADMLATAKLDLERSEVLYRSWKATSTNMIADKNPKWAAWRITAALEGEDMFLKYKEGICVQQHAVNVLQGVFEAVKGRLHQ